MLIDSHAHVGMTHFDRDRKEVIARASETGVQLILTVGTDVPSSLQALAISHEYPSIYAVVGIHPHNTKYLNGKSLRQMREIAQDSRVKAYGEIGLDFFRNLSPPQVQIDGLRQQIRLARDLGLPLVIHDRDAHTEIMKTLEEVALVTSRAALAFFRLEGYH